MNAGATTTPPYIRVFRSLIWPFLVGGVAAALFSNFGYFSDSNGVILAAIGIVSLALGLRWYPLAELGLRGGRPLFAGISFAFLGWVVNLLARFISIDYGPPEVGLGITFLFLLIFEAFCVQLWAFGLFFRGLAEWRNPLSAALLSGVLFGISGWLLFVESRSSSLAVLYFCTWGIFYAMVRLRSGSLLGPVIVQALQSLTVWRLFSLEGAEAVAFGWFYAIGTIGYLILIWRLWPREVSDFRV